MGLTPLSLPLAQAGMVFTVTGGATDRTRRDYPPIVAGGGDYGRGATHP